MGRHLSKPLFVIFSAAFLAACGGDDGADGVNGTNGSNGAPALVTTIPEPSGVNCENGGWRIRSGSDVNANGVLDPTEVTAVSFVCNGNDGNGFTSAIRIDAEPAGANCLHGGNLVSSGLDSNRNGVLDDSEIDQQAYICNGEAGQDGSDGTDGQTSLVTLTDEPAGAQCAAGGTRIDSGLDANSNGTLDAEEITATEYVCSAEDGVDGGTSLVNVGVEPAGANCAAGGNVITSGFDSNQNNILDAGEIEQISYVCNGVDGNDGAEGFSALVDLAQEAPGANCAAGGTRISSGRDINRNDVLDLAEVESVEFVCSGEDGSTGEPGQDGNAALVNLTNEPAGENCAAGGVRVDSGLDGDGNGTLDVAEISHTAYVCNTSGTAPSAPVNLTPILDETSLPHSATAYFVAPDDWLGLPDEVRVFVSSSAGIAGNVAAAQSRSFNIFGGDNFSGAVGEIEEWSEYYSDTERRFLVRTESYSGQWGYESNTVYYMAVSAADFGIETALSNEVVFVPAPDGLALSHTETEATISWTTISGAESYNIYYASQPGVTPQNYLTLPDGTLATTTSNSLTVTGLDPEKPYYFVVAAEAAGTEGPHSWEIDVPRETWAVFNPSLGGDGLPFPHDLLFLSTADGSINIPGKLSTFYPANPGTLASAVATPPAAALADPQTALNTMDGFSTTAPMVVRFSGNIDNSTISSNVRVFRLTTADPIANGALAVDAELVYGVDFVAGASGSTMLVMPLKPLQPSRTHIVVIEGSLGTTTGNFVSADDTYSLLQGSYLLSAGGALGAVSGQPDFVLQADGATPCDLSSLAGLSVCTDVNTEDYHAAAAIQQSAAPIADLLGQLESSGAVSTVIQLEQLRRITAKHLMAVAGAGVDPQGVVLSYSVTTENISAALAQAKAMVDGLVPYDFPPTTIAGAPTIDVLNPMLDWDDGSDSLPYEVQSPQGAANIFLANMSGLLQFVDPDAPNSSVWEAAADPANWVAAPLTPCPYLAAAATGSSNLVGCNAYNPAPKKSDHSIPVLISAPNDTVLAGCPVGDLPVVIYQHGITSSRGSLMAIADVLASQCVIGVAIDLPKHGIVPTGDTFSHLSQLHQGLQQIPAPNPTPVLERLVQTANPAVECQTATGVAIGGASADFYCPSGDSFINLTNLANARDTLRQAVVDLSSLYRALANNDTSNDLTTATIGRRIDAANIHFVGTSFGAMVGTTFVAQQGGNIISAVLNNVGGGIAKIIDGSPQIEPSATSALYQGAGITKPSGDYEAFLLIAQALMDNVDPINYAEAVAASGTPILVQEVIGSPADNIACLVDGTGCPDQVVPNNVFGTSFGPAWGLVAQTGQTVFLTGQNTATVPVGLAGTDPLTQGTGFIALGGAVQAGLLPAANALALGPLGADAATGGAVTFKGMGLPTVTGCGAAGTNGVVRFTSGDHGSMLSPAADPLVTGVMQKQLATFVVSGGMLIADDTLTALGGASAGVVFGPAVASDSTAACAP